MKKALLLIVAFLSLTSCKQIYDTQQEAYNQKMFSDIPVYYGNFEGLETLEDITPWINSRVTYKETDRVLSPEECIIRGQCDCDGYALLWMNIAYVQFGIECDLILVKDESRKIEAGGTINHALVRLPNGTQIAPQNGEKRNYTVRYSYHFDEVFNK